ncbi:MAG: M56 family metallopeptidase [Longimicrobiales bacterium]|nr:M56 family metallopeptidase [Longimicrobiales bacterium]
MMAWMMWSVAVATLLGVSAHLAEWTLRDRNLPGRGPWAVALAGSLAVPAARWLVTRLTSLQGTAEPASSGIVDPAWLLGVGSAAAARTSLPVEILDSILPWGWLLSTCLALALLGCGISYLRRRSERWDRAVVEGHEVLVSEDFGPALIGIGTPRIVLPAWALRLSREALRLACLHEAEHRDAGDLKLLLAGAVALALMPWNPALWWQARRLRAAVEIDCDARVLARGASRRAYGRLLLELGSGGRARSLPAVALAEPVSLLERRMKMIVRNVREKRPVVGITALAGSVVLLVVACDTPPPTDPASREAPPAAVDEGAGVESGNVAGILRLREHARLGESPKPIDARLILDGERVEELPEDLDPSEIERVDITKAEGGEPPTVRVSTLRAEEPLVYLDGARFRGPLSRISAADIDRIEVLKGDAATERYGDEGRNGVILIFSKTASGERPGE